MRVRNGGVENESEGWGVENESEGVEKESEGCGSDKTCMYVKTCMSSTSTSTHNTSTWQIDTLYKRPKVVFHIMK